MESFVDPWRCRVWSLHNRLEESVTERSCAEEIQSVKAGGQSFAAIGRPVRDDPEHDLEIIIGTRRLFIARYLNQKLKVDVRDISDREAVVLIDVENRKRKDLSSYEWGLGYARWIRVGIFRTQEELALALNVSNAKVTRLLKLARLPSVIVNAFGNPANIRVSWGEKLTEVLEDPVRKQPAIRAARAITENSSRPRPKEVYRQLLASAAPTTPGNHKIIPALHDQVIEGKDGTALFRIRHQQDSIALLLPIDRTSAKALKAIQGAVEQILTASTTQVVPAVHEGERFQIGNA